MTNKESDASFRQSGFVTASSLDTRHSSFSDNLVADTAQIAGLLSTLAPHSRIAIDTEADSLHCYREKLCLLQLSVPSGDFVLDPLANVDLAPLRRVLAQKEIVLHGADYDLRLLRRSLDFTPERIFDTVIAARLLGIREFSLAALLKQYFGVELVKGSQKANWARRPLSPRMLEYAINDTRYLLSLAEKLEAKLRETDRLEWFRQSCERAITQAAVDRPRDDEEAWRIAGAGRLEPRTAAVLRELWRWRETEAERVDRPAFHILQNHQLLHAAEAFAAGESPDYRHFNDRRRKAFLQAAARALALPSEAWPVMRRRSGTRPSSAMVRRADELKQRRDQAAVALQIEPAVLAPKSALEAIASEREPASAALVPWQREVLGLTA